MKRSRAPSVDASELLIQESMTEVDLWEALELNPAEFEEPSTIDDLSLENFAHYINEICAKMLTKFIRENPEKMNENTKGNNLGLSSCM